MITLGSGVEERKGGKIYFLGNCNFVEDLMSLFAHKVGAGMELQALFKEMNMENRSCAVSQSGGSFTLVPLGKL